MDRPGQAFEDRLAEGHARISDDDVLESLEMELVAARAELQQVKAERAAYRMAVGDANADAAEWHDKYADAMAELQQVKAERDALLVDDLWGQKYAALRAELQQAQPRETSE